MRRSEPRTICDSLLPTRQRQFPVALRKFRGQCEPVRPKSKLDPPFFGEPVTLGVGKFEILNHDMLKEVAAFDKADGKEEFVGRDRASADAVEHFAAACQAEIEFGAR